MTRPRLKVLTGKNAGEIFQLAAETLIGRDPTNTVQIRDHTVSRHHARIELRDSHILLKDLGSNNGTFVNGQRIAEKLLGDGDKIQIGKTTVQVELGAETVTAEPPGFNVDATASFVVSSEIADAKASSILREEKRDGSSGHLKLRRLFELGQEIGGELDVTKLADRLLSALLEELKGDLAALYYYPSPGRDELALRPSAQIAKLKPTVPRSLLDQALRKGVALRFDSREAPGAERPAQSVVTQQVASALAAPLKGASGLLGALYIDRRLSPEPFRDVDLEFLAVLATQVALALDNALKYARSRARAEQLESQLPGFGPIIGKNPKLLDALGVARKSAASDSPVFITGESGTGKELVARLIHRESPRRDGPFVALNCAALVETLLESELFGHEKGAFTGAMRGKPGRFELAHGGTLFLDEIGDMSPSVQAKLLRAIQEKTFYRVGGTEAVSVDVRIVAATNRDIKAAVKDGSFREDLFFRLGVIMIHLPSLRDRVDDIPALAYHFLEHYSAAMKKPIRTITSEAMRHLEQHDWPGNIRELQNVIERAVVLTESPEIGPEHLPLEVRGTIPTKFGDLPVNLREAEKVCIQRALELTGGKKGEAARILGISHPTLNKKIEDYGIPKP